MEQEMAAAIALGGARIIMASGAFIAVRAVALALIEDRVQAFKVGGMRFVKVRYWGCNKLCVSWCITQK